MIELPILSILTFLPLVGGLGVLAFARGAKSARYIALAVSLLVLGTAFYALWCFDPADGGFQLREQYKWVPAFGLVYQKGVDGISLSFAMFVAFVMPVCVLSAWETNKSSKGFMAALLALEAMLIGAFTALDFISFYIFSESVIVPIFFMIGLWGGGGRVNAAYKFLFYSLSGSALALVAIFFMILQIGTTDMTAMLGDKFTGPTAVLLWIAFLLSFAVKVLVWPLHAWLPSALIEVPVAGVVAIVGAMLKVGGYGYIRISLQMFPEISAQFSFIMIALGLITIIYAAVVALFQKNLKKLLIYLCIASGGGIIIAMFSGNQESLNGAIMAMLLQGVVFAGLFICVDIMHSRLNVCDFSSLGQLAKGMPRLSLHEWAMLLPLAGLIILMGFFPSMFISLFSQTTASIVSVGGG